jgi:DNA primase catalytic core
MPRFSQAELEDLKKTIDLVALVRAKGVDLKPHGKDLLGLCPFHDDREPSLVVTPSKNLWHCLGACQTGGDVIEWVQKAEGISFRHAVELLRDGHASRLVTSGKVANHSTVSRLPSPVDLSADDHLLLKQVVDYYHSRLKESPAALAYLQKRGIKSEEALLKFKLGFADRTLGLRLPHKNRKEGAEVRERLMQIGIYRESGHEHFNGSIVIPVMDEHGIITEIYGRKINDNLRQGTPYHLYLPGPHRGIWNPEALKQEEVILCESLLDALTFWVNGFRNVTASYGIEGFTQEHLSGLINHRVKRVYIAYDHDEAGDNASDKLADTLTSEGIECYRIRFPHQTDANSYACQVSEPGSSLGNLIRSAEWMGKPGRSEPSGGERPEQASDSILSPAVVEARRRLPLADPSPSPETAKPKIDIPATIKGEDIHITFGEREYRIRGLAKNMSFEVMRVNVRVSVGDRYHIDTLDLYNARHRTAFINTAAEGSGAEGGRHQARYRTCSVEAGGTAGAADQRSA